MIGCCYLCMAILLGERISSLLFSSVPRKGVTQGWVALGASFGLGVLFQTWATYLAAWFFHVVLGRENALTLANIVVLSVVALLVGISHFLRWKKGKVKPFLFLEKPRRYEVIYIALVLAFFLFIFFYVFQVRGSQFYAGFTVFSDYGPHTAMIRSFSMSNNYPTQYPHFGGEDVRYHFLFQFLVGNLEYLGMRLDFAYNLASAFSITSFFMVGLGISQSLGFGPVGCILPFPLFLFRSGTAFLRFLYEHLAAGDLLLVLRENTTFLGYTQNENWGFWNLNVYANQRHLCFGLCIMAIAIYYFLSYMPVLSGILLGKKNKAEDKKVEEKKAEETKPEETKVEEIKAEETKPEETKVEEKKAEETKPEETKPEETKVEEKKVEGESQEGILQDTGEEGNIPEQILEAAHAKETVLEAEQAKEKQEEMKTGGPVKETKARSAGWLSRLFFSKEAWMSKDLGSAMLLGLAIGLTSFWNGAAVIGGLLILAGMALFSEGKLDYLIVAIFSVVFAFLQTRFFIFGSAMEPAVQIGFLAEQKNLLGILWYLVQITGLGILGLFFVQHLLPERSIKFFYACLLPCAFAFLFSLTPDIGVNHKYIMICYAFCAFCWGGALESLAKKGKIALPSVLLLSVLLMATGFYDFVVILKDNDARHRLAYPLHGEVTQWCAEHFTEKDLILSPLYSMSEVTLSGAMLYNGWPYYAWSAGYDTYSRSMWQERIYTATDPYDVIALCEQEGIDYIVYESGMDLDGVYVYDDVIREACHEPVYENGYLRIYQVPGITFEGEFIP